MINYLTKAKIAVVASNGRYLTQVKIAVGAPRDKLYDASIDSNSQ